MNPFIGMAVLNAGSGAFSALVGLGKLRRDPVSASRFDSSNPWLYVLGGLLTVLLGVGNWFLMPAATWGTIAMILSSFYNGNFGAGKVKPFPFFYTLNAYALLQTVFVVWSYFPQ